MIDVTVRAISHDQHEAVMHYFDVVAYADNPNWSKRSERASPERVPSFRCALRYASRGLALGPRD